MRQIYKTILLLALVLGHYSMYANFPSKVGFVSLFYDFDDGMQNWTTIDADGDGYSWESSSWPGSYINSSLSGLGHNSSNNFMLSGSYSNIYGVLTPDNYLVCPIKSQYSQISFWVCAQDNSWAAEHFGVAVSTASNTNASDFTTIKEWTLASKGISPKNKEIRGNNRSQGTWYELAVNLSEYEGQDIWVAIRHFNCTDMFCLDIDDITIGGDNNPITNTLIYVKSGGAGNKDGSSWDNAMDNINSALAYAGSFLDKPAIWVAGGTYYGDGIADHNAFTMADGVDVYGGFAGNEPADYDLAQRDFDTNETILDGQNVQRVLYQCCAFNNQTTWDGFTIQNGCLHKTSDNSIDGAGVYLYGHSGLKNCKIFNNTIYDGDGAGIYVGYGSSNYIINCRVINNNLIWSTDNAYHHGAGICAHNADIINCVIANNCAADDYAGGIYGDGTCNVYNCDIVNNKAKFSGGIHGQVNVQNCIIWGNYAVTDNNIVYYNTSINHCAVEDGFGGEGNINLSSENNGGLFSPRFVNPSPNAGVLENYGDYSWKLQEGSICINRGYVAGLELPEYDLTGNPRIQQGIIDMGCYESPYQSIDIPTYDNGIVYVTQTGAGSKNGTSWANAFDNIQDAITCASIYGIDVWIASGTYVGDSIAEHNAFTMADGVDVYGGFAGNEPVDYDLTQRDFDTNETILDGQNVQRVLYQPRVFSTYTTWDGFTIIKGYQYTEEESVSSYGAGVYLINKVTLQNCKLTENYAYSKYNSVVGGSLYANAGYGGYTRTTNIINCDIYNNLTGSERTYSRTLVYGHYVTMTGCRVFDNPVYGEAVAVSYSNVDNCEITNNGAGTYCTGLYCYDCNITNCLISNNSSGGISCFYSYIYNCDIVNNNRRGATFNNTGSIQNCIVWGNTNDQIYLYGGNGTNETSVTYCAVEGGFSGEGNICLSSNNDNSLLSPRFVNPSPAAGVMEEYGDYSWELQEGSICINRGDAAGLELPEYDLAGNPRIQQGVIDMGCYESPYQGIEIPTYDNGIVYVTQTGAGSKNGTSWANACDNIQDAITYASIYGIDVWIASGTYVGDSIAEHNAFTMVDGVNVYGGFAGNEPADYDLTQRDFETNETILDGQNVQRVLYQPNDFTTYTTWSGFTLRNGYIYIETNDSSANGAGASLKANANLEYCKITNNSIYFQSHLSGGRGAGVSIIGTNHNSLLSNCTISNNHLIMIEVDTTYSYSYSHFGSGVYANTANINNCYIINNQSTGNHYGICAANANVSNSLIANNCGGVLVYDINSWYSSSFINCDIVNNKAYFTGGIYAEYASSAMFKNCIIWGNDADYYYHTYDNIYYNGDVSPFSYCAIEGGYSGEGNINISSENLGDGYFHPRFTNPSPVAGVMEEYADYSWELLEGSICINRGDATGLELPEYDLAGNQRVQQEVIDMGCYESPYQGLEMPTYDDSIVYVTTTGAGSKDGTSWANAADDINGALLIAQSFSVPNVWIAKGTYYGDSIAENSAFTMVDGVNVYGGFAGNEAANYNLAQRNLTTNATILDGQNVQKVLYQPNSFSNITTWDGFTITNGYLNLYNYDNYNDAAGVTLKDHSALKNCRISNCKSTYKSDQWEYNDGCAGVAAYGYYWYNEDNTIVIENCKINDNMGNPAVSCYRTSIDNCEIINNACSGLEAQNSIITHSKIMNNANGGCQYLYYCNMSDCLISNNQSTWGVAGIYCSSSTITNCDIVNNKTSGYGAGVSFDDANSSFTNCIIWGNRGYNSPDNILNNNYVSISPLFNHCAIEGGFDGEGVVYLSSDNDGNAFSPRFANPSPSAGLIEDADDYSWQLLNGSICINRGDITGIDVSEYDLAGNQRVKQGAIDIGCYESPYQGVEFPAFNSNIVYVTPQGAGTKDGSSWDNAMDNIQTAIAFAAMYNINVWVAAGIYYGDGNYYNNAVTIYDGVNVYGGFAGDEPADYDLALRDFEANESVIDGQYNQRAVYMLIANNATTIDGFTLQDANPEGVGSVYIGDETFEHKAVINNCIIRDNFNMNSGGGVYLFGGKMENCSVENNYTYGNGGGVFVCNAEIYNSKICNNISIGLWGGGGIYESQYSTSSIIDNCLIYNNLAILSNYDESNGLGGGMFLVNASVSNCDIINNHSANEGSGVYFFTNDESTFNASVMNSIIWGNVSDSESTQINEGGTLLYCAVEGGFAGTGNINLANENNGNENLNYVRFINPATDDFQLRSNSICVDAGNPYYTPAETVDLAGNQRVFNNRIDIGCYEYDGNNIIWTDISDEVCYGDDYVENGFDIVNPALGENLYSLTLQSEIGYDSIVNLTLMVHPNYFVEIDTILCDQTSFLWNGNTYTESGIYYDSLQTVHGCDSIMKLSLEFFNTPLGEFTYMTPTNNYPFTSLPITFTWTAVEGAQYYDLYIWGQNELVPDEPFAANLTSGYYSTTGLLNYHTYNWFVKARNHCYETSSDTKSFYLDIMPTINVNVPSINFGEVALNESRSTTLNISGVVLEDTLSVQIVGDDANMFSFAKATGWNDYTGGILIITFHPTIVQYSYNADVVVTSGTLTQTTTLTGGIADMFVFNTYVDDDIYAMNTQIPIHGTVYDLNSNPVADAEVEIGVFVMNTKRTLQTVTDEAGQFEAIFEPYYSESGYYTVNSGRVGNNSTAIHAEFNIPGMMLVSSDYNLCAVTQDQSHTDSILIRNKSNIALSNITASAITAPEGASFSFMPLSLGGLEEGYLIYTAEGSTLTEGSYYQEAKLLATSSEGAEMNFSIWYYCSEAHGILDVAPKSLTTTMTKGYSKIVDVMLTNNGTAETGDIYIDLPDVEWMSVVGYDTLSSIAVNDTAYFSLRFSPNNDIALGQYTGSIAINSERGDFYSLPYTITAVSEATGSVVVDVTDDYTWNTNGGFGPHLEGAEVTLTGYYSLETVAHGYTDSDGNFIVNDVPEGYYRLQISADHHSQFNNTILVTAGETNTLDVYLQYQAITYSWNVVPTEIDDEYTFQLDVVYETNVPAPVVVIELSSQVPDLECGESYTFNAIVTNHGLIAAKDFQLLVPQLNEYVFTPLYEYVDSLPALTTIIIPITVTRVQPGRYYSKSQNDNPCWARIGAKMYYVCGEDNQWHYAYSRDVFINTCAANAIAEFLESLIWWGGGNGGGGGGSGGGGENNLVDPAMQVKVGCSPCDVLLPDLAQSAPIIGDFAYLADNVPGNDPDWYDQTLYWGSKLPVIGELIDAGVFFGNLAAFVHCSVFGLKNQSLSLEDFEYISRFNDDLISLYNELYQDSMLYETTGFELLNSLLLPYYSDIIEISEDEANSIKSNFTNLDISESTIDEIINRWNQTVAAWNNNVFEPDSNYPNIINKVHLESIGSDISEISAYANSIGYASLYDMAEDLLAILDDELETTANSVCCKVKVRFSQNMTMTREAFLGTLSIKNGHPLVSMEAINVSFVIKDSQGNDCTNLFQINTLSLNNMTGIDGSGSIGGGKEGIAKIQFIPTRQAAPTEPKVYYFGGSFSFIDPYTGDEIHYDLYPVEITVNPSPDLYVDYFMQRDILGDDALTLDKVEPSIPAELGVIINNKGAGMAKNVILETAEPQIIDNDKGLAIDFAMYGASFNGSPRQLGLMEIPFGNIESGHTAVGEWFFTSSLLGHFISYEAHVIHNSSYGNPDLSLVSSLKIHELIHPIYAYGDLDDGINDFLVNDDDDAYDMPDSIYFSHGGKTAVGIVDNISYDHVVTALDTIVTLTINPSRIGWNYGVTSDPGADKFELVSCTRNSDGQEIPLSNIWQTFVTIPDGGDPVYENKLHIVDTLSNDVQDFTYTLVYSLKTNLLDVEEITGIPENYIDYPLESFTVKFNEAIIDSTFTYEDMTLKCQNGPNLMDESVVITKVDETSYNVDISNLTNETGLFVLNVHTLNICDTRGYGGYNGKQASWVQVLINDTVYIEGNQTICENGEFAPLTSFVEGNAVTYQWNHGGIPIEGANDTIYQPVEAGVYSLTVTFADNNVMTSNEVILDTYQTYQTPIVANICFGEDYTENGFNFVAPEVGIYNETLNLQSIHGCDSIVTLTLTVNPVYDISLTDEICFGEDYNLYGFNFVAPEVGVHTQTLNLQTVTECDSIVTMTLNVNPIYDIYLTDEICFGEDYNLYGFNFVAPEVGVHTQTLNLQTVTECDSIVTMTLTVNPIYDISLTDEICFGEDYNLYGFSFNAPEVGIHTQTLNLQTVNECDSIVTMTLTVNPVYDIQLTDEICFGEDYNLYGFNFVAPEVGVHTQTLNLQTVNECDSIVTMTLTVNPVYDISLTDEICFGEDYNLYGFNFVAPEVGVHTQTLNLQTVTECDSIVTMTLTVNPVYDISLTDDICFGEDYNLYGFNFVAPEVGVHTQTLNLQTVNECDSIVTMTLTVFDNPVVIISGDTLVQTGQSVTLTASGADSYIWSTGETTASIVVTPTETTTYSVIGTDSHGCSGQAEITVTIVSGTGDNGLLASIRIYPNPTQNSLVVEGEGMKSIAIVNSYGVTVHKIWEINKVKCPVDLTNYPSGIYYLKIATNEGETIRKVVKY